jgi:hypothetical protein
MRDNGFTVPKLPLLDIVDQEINALAQKAKDLRRIQRDGTGRNGTKLALTGSNWL